MKFIRALMAMIMGWLMMRLVRSLVAVSQRAAAPEIHKKDPSALDMVRCPRCGVFTSGACANPQCVRI